MDAPPIRGSGDMDVEAGTLRTLSIFTLFGTIFSP